MATAAQNIANQANAHHSTGPRTLEGKARISQNAVRHGLTAKHLVVREDERKEFATLQDSLTAELAPRELSKLSLSTSCFTLPGTSSASAESSPKPLPVRSATSPIPGPLPSLTASAATRRVRSGLTTKPFRSSVRSRPTAPSAPSNSTRKRTPKSRS